MLLNIREGEFELFYCTASKLYVIQELFTFYHPPLTSLVDPPLGVQRFLTQRILALFYQINLQPASLPYYIN